MLKKRELHKLESKEREWDRTLREWKKKRQKVWKVIWKEIKNGGKWFFFYQPKNKMDAMLHIIAWFAYIYIGWFALVRR